MGPAPADLLEPDAAPADVVFARQPILDSSGTLAGYELLYRGDASDSPHAATSRVALSALSELGLRRATGGAPAFINVTSEFLLALDPMPFGPEGVVLEVAADRVYPEPLAGRLQRLHEHGYRLAIDGFAGQPQARELLAYCTLAKVDARTVPAGELEAVVTELTGAGARPIAYGVQTRADREHCADAGFEYFQGEFLCEPKAVHGVPPDASIGAVRLAAAIAQSADGDIDALDRAISLDPGLSLRLLRFVNSAAFSLRHQIRSVRQAIVLLGPATVRQWATLLVLSGIDETQGPLITTALSRARTCETIAGRLGADDTGAYFFAGMMSVADALLGVPMAVAIDGLPLADDVVAALLDRSGGKGRTLTMAEACERGEWDQTALPTLDPSALALMHVEALAWADANLRGLA